MKLYYSLASPYVRKVRMATLELGLADRIELVLTNAWTATEGLPQDNPLCKVPTLVLDDGSSLFDSPVICEYLDSLVDGGGTLFPRDGAARWNTQRLHALGDGLCDAAVARRLETMRPENLQSADWIARQRAAMVRALDTLEGWVPDLSGPVTIGALAVATALGYLDLRFADDDWRSGRPALAAWFAAASERPSFQATVPVP
jgi:glutathione S-transferase